ncbi:MDR family MFS transporter [Paenibacillus alkalitolerans]|uniref:MDR family MFS transporter n=1 Tax=Paenibacillus alkalitolerans TaxID=2799335 RepID=UPI0018F36659|nr:MFS transporter [Paenibacillus alkalitolerans]
MKFRDFHPNIRIRIALGFFGSLLFNMVIPYMAIYFARELGSAVAGIALTGGVIVGFAASFLSGYWSDRIGRKPLMVGAEFVWLGSYALMALAASAWVDSAWLALAASFGVQIGWGLFGPSSDGMLLDVTSPEQRKYMYSIFYWSNNLAIALGGMVGAYLFATHLTGLLIALTAMTAVSTAITLWRIDETHRPAHNYAAAVSAFAGIGDVLRSYGRVLRDRTFMLFMVANLLVLSSEFHIGNYIGVRLADEMGIRTLFSWGESSLSLNGVQMLGLLRTENTLFVVLFSILAVAAMRRFKEKHTLFAGMILYVTGYAFQMYSNDPWPLIVAMALATWGEVVNVPIRMAYHGSITPDDARGAYMAVGGLTHTGASMIGTLAVSLGAVFPSWSMGLIALFVGVSGIVLFAGITPKLDERMHRASSGDGAQVSPASSQQTNSAAATL